MTQLSVKKFLEQENMRRKTIAVELELDKPIAMQKCRVV